MPSFRVEVARGSRKLNKVVSGTGALEKPHAYIIPRKVSFPRLFQKRYFELFLLKMFWLISIREFRNRRRGICFFQLNGTLSSLLASQIMGYFGAQQ